MKNIKYNFAVITENFPPCAGGGIAEWALGVSENLARFGHKVTVYSKWKGNVDLNIHNDKMFNIKRMRGHDWRKFRFWYSLYYIRKFLKTNPNGVILATSWELGHPFVFLKRRFPKAKLITIAHGLEVTKVNTDKKLKSFQQTINSSQLAAAVSNFTKEAIIEKMPGYNTDHIIFIPNGVDLNRFYPVDDYSELLQKYNLKPDNKIILTLARVIERKGHDIVIKSLPRILKEFPKTVYIIAGPWKEAYYKYLKDLIKQLNLEGKVIFTGFVDDKDLNAFYSMSDIYIMISRFLNLNSDSEGFGITFLEANACQTPVIGSNSGGIPDAINNGVSGFIIPPDQPSVLADKILKLFRNPELSVKMGKQGQERIKQNFTWEIITEKLLKYFQKQNKDIISG